MSRKYGKNYNPTYKTKDVAAIVRKELKKMYPWLKLSITTNIYAGGSAINVRINEGFPGHLYILDRDNINYKVTKRANYIKDSIKDYINTYGFDGSDSMTDYYDVNFYVSVEYNGEVYNDEETEIDMNYSIDYMKRQELAETEFEQIKKILS